jgi:hypothetical protein
VSKFVERVASRASEVKLSRAALTLLATPFYVLGLLVGLAVVSARWIGAAVLIGVDDVRHRSDLPGDS